MPKNSSAALRIDEGFDRLQYQPSIEDVVLNSRYSRLPAAVRQALMDNAMGMSIDELIGATDSLISMSGSRCPA